MPMLTAPLIAAAERAVGEPMPYLRTLADASGSAFLKWMAAMPAASHRSAAPRDAWHLARLGATVAQDCGTCVQVVVTVARKDGVAVDLLRRALDAPDALPEVERQAFAFGRAVALRADDVADRVAEVEATFGHAAHVDLAMAVAMCHIFPVVKRGLGMGQACALVTVDVGD